MKKTVLALSLPLLFAGCFSTPPPTVACWTIAPKGSEAAAVADSPKFGEVRLAVVSVRAPFDGKPIAVLRQDGSMAFDPYNQFASVPSALMKGAALDVLRGTGLFKGVQPSITTADVDTALELTVDEVALDCRAAGERKACVRLTLAMVRKRLVVAAGRGSAAVDTADGDYSKAFGAAFARALSGAAAQLVKE